VIQDLLLMESESFSSFVQRFMHGFNRKGRG